MRYVSTTEMYEIDSYTSVTPLFSDRAELIEVAGYAIYRKLLDILSNRKSDFIYIFVGNGNNGIDALISGLLLRKDGYKVKFVVARAKDKCSKGIADRISKANLSGDVVYIEDEDCVRKLTRNAFVDNCIIVDGLLGIGFIGEPHGVVGELIRLIQRLKNEHVVDIVISIDIPSGMIADSGDHTDCVVSADITLCMGMPKLFVKNAFSRKLCGSVYVLDIGIDDKYLQPNENEDTFVAEYDVRRFIPRLFYDSHKGSQGHTIVIGGCNKYSGAIALNGIGAMSCGSGLVTVLTLPQVIDRLRVAKPEMILRAIEAYDWSTDALLVSDVDLTDKAVVVGSGMGDHYEKIQELILAILDGKFGLANGVVIDADGLNSFSREIELLRNSKIRNVILTPHPGEAARLLGVSVAEINSNREACVKELSELSGATVVLKGAGSVIASIKDKEGVALVGCGNPFMACGGGMGDVLAGMCGALLAKRMCAYNAARVATYLHAHAGDLCLWENGFKKCFTATDVASNVRRYL